MQLTREQILKTKDIDVKEVEVPAWGGTVFVRQFSAADRDRLSEYKRSQPDNNGIREQLVLIGCCDEAGVPLFTADDLEALSGKNSEPLEVVAYEVMKYNGMTAEAIEEAEKN